MMNASNSPRGRGRGRGRRGRPPTKHREERYVKCEDDDNDIMCDEQDDAPTGQSGQSERAEKETNPQVAPPLSTSVTGAAETSTAVESKQGQNPAWPLPDGMGNIGIEPSRLVQLTMQIDEDEDYDNED